MTARSDRPTDQSTNRPIDQSDARRPPGARRPSCAPCNSIVATTTNVAETRAVAGAVASLCVPGDVLLLAGDLGAGKTAFAQGFGRALGVTEPITSPTFTLVRQYPVHPVVTATGVDPTPTATGIEPVRTLLHADVYRLDHLQEIADLGLGELVEDSAVALVEWGDMAEPILGEGSLAVRLEVVEHLGDCDRRSITIASSGDGWLDRWGRLVAATAPWSAAA